MDLDIEAKNASKLLRRRIIFSLIILLSIFIGVGAAMKLLLWSYLFVPATALAIYLIQVRRDAKQNRLKRKRVEEIQRTSEGISHLNLSEVITVQNTTVENWVPLAEREQTGVTILPRGTAAQKNTWKPQDVPVPTYVSAPKAVTPRRVIDLTTPGAWTEEQERIEREILAAAAPSVDETFEKQLAEEVTPKKQNRASNQ